MEYKKVNEKTTFETFDFIVSKAEQEDLENEKYNSFKKTYFEKGFRKGHVPINMIKKQTNIKQWIDETVKNIIVYEKFFDVTGIEVNDSFLGVDLKDVILDQNECYIYTLDVHHKPKIYIEHNNEESDLNSLPIILKEKIKNITNSLNDERIQKEVDAIIESVYTDFQDYFYDRSYIPVELTGKNQIISKVEKEESTLDDYLVEIDFYYDDTPVKKNMLIDLSMNYEFGLLNRTRDTVIENYLQGVICEFFENGNQIKLNKKIDINDEDRLQKKSKYIIVNKIYKKDNYIYSSDNYCNKYLESSGGIDVITGKHVNEIKLLQNEITEYFSNKKEIIKETLINKEVMKIVEDNIKVYLDTETYYFLIKKQGYNPYTMDEENYSITVDDIQREYKKLELIKVFNDGYPFKNNNDFTLKELQDQSELLYDLIMFSPKNADECFEYFFGNKNENIDKIIKFLISNKNKNSNANLEANYYIESLILYYVQKKIATISLNE